MFVTIKYRNSYHGGDGWTYYPVNILIGDNCPICGQKRGVPSPESFCEDGEWFTVDKWINPCGHIDKYKECYLEYLSLAQNKIENIHYSRLQNPPVPPSEKKVEIKENDFLTDEKCSNAPTFQQKKNKGY